MQDPEPRQSRAIAGSQPRLIALTALALTVCAIALWLYAATLLPGFDLGDTASFQAAADTPAPTPRQAYPLYFAICKLFLWLGRGVWEPAYALNFASAVCGALACGLLAAAAASISRCLGSGLVAGLLFAGSYTFWSQSVIAEVYALEALGMGAALVTLLAWSRKPTTWRMALFFAVYAIGFGNHLSSILLAPAFALFALATAPRLVLRPHVLALAAGIAAVAALQYVWNLSALWAAADPSATLADLLRTFWFDVTKGDWRESLVMTVPASQRSARAAMYWFDLRQQFGVAGAALACLGLLWLVVRGWRLALLVVTLYAATGVFAFTYNVGDTHVFYLPSHVAVALAIGAGVAALVAMARRIAPRAASLAAVAVVALALGYAAWRIYDTFPAVDRSRDDRSRIMFDRFTAGIDPRGALLVGDLNWQVQNGLDYYVRHVRPELTIFRTADQAMTLPFLTAVNDPIDREILLTDDARERINAQYSGLYEIREDPRVPTPTMFDQVQAVSQGTAYVLAVLTPYREWPYDRSDLERTLSHLGISQMPAGRYALAAGFVGTAPVIVVGQERPFRTRVQLGHMPVDIRMEAWLPFDTMRRAGFGHVIVRHRHAFTIERGVNFVAFDGEGRPSVTAYAGGLFAPKKRWVLRRRLLTSDF
jgi:hypothetical protein